MSSTQPFRASSCCNAAPSNDYTYIKMPSTFPDQVAQDHSPIIIDWPPKPPPPVDDQPDTGPRYDLLAQIPDQIAPQTLHVVAVPQTDQAAVARPHPLCPDSMMHMRFNPKQPPPPPRIVLPPQKCPVRGPPCRPWLQCVENSLLTDAVRRPMARRCYHRPLPPLVLPKSKIEQMHCKITERERLKEEREERRRQWECARLASRDRQGRWNYTVESLLTRKAEKEQERVFQEQEETRQLIKEMEQDNKARSEEQVKRAKRLTLYRKGLIRDFHSAMAYSKMMQEIEEEKSSPAFQLDPEGCPLFVQKCYKKMMNVNETRPDYSKVNNKMKDKQCSERLMNCLQQIEQRSKEHQQELNAELCQMKRVLEENLPDLPQKYKDYIKDPVCETAEQKKERRDCDFADKFQEVQAKLQSDAFIEGTERETGRQVCEFRNYKRDIEAIRKQVEKQLIEEKVARNMEKAERAAEALVRMRRKEETLGIGGDYEQAKMQWESEWEDKKKKERRLKDDQMDQVFIDFEKRKLPQNYLRCQLDPCRQWAREQLFAEENITRACEDQNERRRKAQEIQLFNRSQAQANHSKANAKRFLEEAQAAKQKQVYFDEVKEMKAYADECIDDWKRKGRKTEGMEKVVKRFYHDSAMTPSLFETEQKRNNDMKGACGDGVNVCSGGGGGPEKQKPSSINTSSKRLGFGAGGCP